MKSERETGRMAWGIAMLMMMLSAAALVLPSSRDAQARGFRDRAWADEGRGERVSKNDFHWHGKLSAGQTIEIKGVNGDIQAEPASGNEVEVTAVRTARRSDPDQVRIEVVPHSGGVTICAIYPHDDGSAGDCVAGDDMSSHSRHRISREDRERDRETRRRNRDHDRDRDRDGDRDSDRDGVRDGSFQRNNDDSDDNDNNDVRVQFTVRVPRQVVFAGHTVNGKVTAESLDGDVRISSVNGPVSVSTRGTAEATTVNGRIDATIGRPDWKGTLEFRTVNGSIDVHLPRGTSAQVSAETMNGDLESDFPMTVTGHMRPQQMSGTIGSSRRGSGELELQTLNGSIHLHSSER